MSKVQLEVQIIEKKWKSLSSELSLKLGEELDIQAIIYLVGLQELGFNFKKFSKDQKLDIMHVAICTLLLPYGYYTFDGRDKDHWPHFTATDNLPNLKAGQQLQLMKEAIINYFEKV